MHTGAAAPAGGTKATSTHTCQELKVQGLPDALHAFQLSGTTPLRNYYHRHFTNRENKRARSPSLLLRAFCCVCLFATLWTAACQAPPSWGFSSKKTGAGCHALLQGIFPTQGMNSHLLRHRQILHHWSTRKVLSLVGPCKKPCFAPNSELVWPHCAPGTRTGFHHICWATQGPVPVAGQPRPRAALFHESPTVPSSFHSRELGRTGDTCPFGTRFFGNKCDLQPTHLRYGFGVSPPHT